MTHGKPPGGIPRTTLRAGAFEVIPDTGSTPMPPSNVTSESSAVARNDARDITERTRNSFFMMPPSKIRLERLERAFGSIGRNDHAEQQLPESVVWSFDR